MANLFTRLCQLEEEKTAVSGEVNTLAFVFTKCGVWGFIYNFDGEEIARITNIQYK